LYCKRTKYSAGTDKKRRYRRSEVIAQGLRLKLLRGPNEDLYGKPQAALWRWRYNSGNWTYQKQLLHLISCERHHELRANQF